jgi:ribosome-binding protein aMBF1 (putative translation factor)
MTSQKNDSCVVKPVPASSHRVEKGIKTLDYVECNADEVRKRFGERVRLRRKELGLSQSQLFEKTGIAASYISNVENGWGNPSLGLMIKLSASLNINLLDMLRP